MHHLVTFAVKWGISTQQSILRVREMSFLALQGCSLYTHHNHTNTPNVNRLTVASTQKDFRGYVAWGTTCRCQNFIVVL